MTDGHLKMIDDRYAKRQQDADAGWANAESYQHKAEEFDRIVGTHGIPIGARVLELGCGAGNTTLYATEKGFDAYGIDISPRAIEWARKRACQRNVCAHFSVCSGTDLHVFEDDFFDLILDGHCLWMVLGMDRQDCFNCVFRKLKPGGLFYALAHVITYGYDTPYDIAPGARFEPVQLTSTVRNVPMYQFSTESGFRSEIGNAGFQILNCSPLRYDVLDRRNRDEMPFVAGSFYIEARKPASGGRSGSGGVISSPLPHHRTCGSASGGSDGLP